MAEAAVQSEVLADLLGAMKSDEAAQAESSRAAATADKDGVADLCGDGTLLKEIKVQGTGEETPKTGDAVKCHYTGTLLDGTKFDSSRDRDEPFKFTIGSGVITGWSEGVATMKLGERANFTICSDKAYGDSGSPPTIPGGATLMFDIELLEFTPPPPKDMTLAGDGGVTAELITEGEEWDTPEELGEVTVDIKFMTADGTITDQRAGVNFVTDDGSECRAVSEAVTKMKKGEANLLTIQPSYGPKGTTEVITAEVKLVDFVKQKSTWELQDDDARVEAIAMLREAGNTLFKVKAYHRALPRYVKAAKVVTDTKKASAEVKAAIVPCLLNAAACQLKLNQYRAAEKSCTDALEMDKSSVKGLYRRGEALLGLGEWDEAKADLNKCLALDAGNKAAAKTLSKVKAEMKGFAQKQKGLFGGMFDKMAAADAKKAVAEPEAAPPAESAEAAAPAVVAIPFTVQEAYKTFDDDASFGKAAPSLETLKYLKGEPVALGGGRVTVVLFFAKFAKGDYTTVQGVSEVAAAFPSVQFLGISVDPSEDDAKSFLKKIGTDMPEVYIANLQAPYALAWDDRKVVKCKFMQLAGAASLGASATFVVDGEGNVVWREQFGQGYFPPKKGQLCEQVRRLVAGEGVSKANGATPVVEDDDDDEMEMGGEDDYDDDLGF